MMESFVTFGSFFNGQRIWRRLISHGRFRFFSAYLCDIPVGKNKMILFCL
jgi:hypothetical protein